jgi:hypothetical protein
MTNCGSRAWHGATLCPTDPMILDLNSIYISVSYPLHYTKKGGGSFVGSGGTVWMGI